MKREENKRSIEFLIEFIDGFCAPLPEEVVKKVNYMYESEIQQALWFGMGLKEAAEDEARERLTRGMEVLRSKMVNGKIQL